MSLTQFYINGAWVDPAVPETLDVINPATEEVAAVISVGSAADVDKAVAAAKAAFPKHAAPHGLNALNWLQKFVKSINSGLMILPMPFKQKWGRRLIWHAARKPWSVWGI